MPASSAVVSVTWSPTRSVQNVAPCLRYCVFWTPDAVFVAISATGTSVLYQRESPRGPGRRRCAGPLVDSLRLRPRQPRGVLLDGVAAALAGARAHGVVDRGDEDLALADLVALERSDDGAHDGLHVLLEHDHLDLHLGVKAVLVGLDVLAAREALLHPEALDLGDRHAQHALDGQRLGDRVEVVRLDVALDLLHRDSSFAQAVRRRPGRASSRRP